MAGPRRPGPHAPCPSTQNYCLLILPWTSKAKGIKYGLLHVLAKTVLGARGQLPPPGPGSCKDQGEEEEQEAAVGLWAGGG